MKQNSYSAIHIKTQIIYHIKEKIFLLVTHYAFTDH